MTPGEIVLVHDPPKVLVKVTFFAFPEAKNVYNAPPIPLKTKLIAFASVKGPLLTVVAVLVLFVTLTTDVPVMVRFVPVLVVQTVPKPVTVTFPVPKAIVLVFELLLANWPQVSVLLFRLSVPAVSVTSLLEATVKASCKTHEPPVPLNVNGLEYETPFDVTVCEVVALSVIVPMLLNVFPEATDQLPETVIVPLLVKVMLLAETVKLKQVNAPVKVTV